MAANKEKIEERNKAVFQQFKVLYDEKYLRYSRCIELLSKQFYKGEETIKKIITAEKKKEALQVEAA